MKNTGVEWLSQVVYYILMNLPKLILLVAVLAAFTVYFKISSPDAESKPIDQTQENPLENTINAAKDAAKQLGR